MSDGSYTLITLHDKVHVLSGPAITRNDVNTFTRLFGDLNGDGVVNYQDAVALGIAETATASKYDPALDYNSNGLLDKIDFAEFRKHSGKRIALPTAASPAGTPAATHLPKSQQTSAHTRGRAVKTHEAGSVVIARRPPRFGHRG